jgi:hypothetical protein
VLTGFLPNRLGSTQSFTRRRLMILCVVGWCAHSHGGKGAEAESQDRTHEDMAGPVRKYYMRLMPAHNMERLNLGHTVGYRHSSCSSLAVGLLNGTRDYSPYIAGHRSNCDRGQASSREKDILIRIWQD